MQKTASVLDLTEKKSVAQNCSKFNDIKIKLF